VLRTTEEAAAAAGAPKPVGAPRAAATAAVGLGLLLIGGHLFVRGAISVAHALEVSDRLIGITVVAVGTSLPELVTAVIAARRGHSDLALGNILGSNIFNVLLCLGGAAATRPVPAVLSDVVIDVGAMVALTALAAFLLRTQRKITRVEGGVLLGAYVLFLNLLVLEGAI
jgi:cation:H+ antiporter